MEASNMVWSLCGIIACKTQLRPASRRTGSNQSHKWIQPKSDRLQSQQLGNSEGASKQHDTAVVHVKTRQYKAERDNQERVNKAKREAFIRETLRGAPDMTILGAPFLRVDVCRPTM